MNVVRLESADRRKRRLFSGPRWVGRFVSHEPLAAIAALFLLGVVMSGVLADVISPNGPNQQDIANRLRPPVWAGGTGAHVLGTDGLGRDVLSRLIHGVRLALMIPAVGVSISMTLGVALGLVAGYYGGRADAIIMRVADLEMAFSTYLLILVIVVMVGPGVGTLMLVFGIAHWVIYARVVRGSVLSLQQAPFIEGARSLGCRDRRIIFLHIMPNVTPLFVSLGVIEMARLMVAEAGLSFLGFGVQPPTVTWGLMIAAGREYLSVAWWLVTFPGLSITFSVLAVSLVGVWLRDSTGPYHRVRS